MAQASKIVLPGGAGLVGQNVVTRLAGRAGLELVVIDKHEHNLDLLRRRHPDVRCVLADLAEGGEWGDELGGADVVVVLQSQIGARDSTSFVRNTLESTTRVLDAIERHGVPYTVHVSSSVVESVADDAYTRTKREQERMVLERGLDGVVLRPTLMFGWFDRKHLGWLARFMRRVPLFPIPGDGRFVRQPLYAGDFARIVIRCAEGRDRHGVYDITGVERVSYVEIIRAIKRVTGARARIVHIPYGLFRTLLSTWALFDRDPPFTADQLAALVAGDEFEVIDWPSIFGVAPTPFEIAIAETFTDPRHSTVELAF